MTVRSASLMSALQVFLGIYVTQSVEFSFSQWHVFYITILKIIYVHNDDTHNTYETCILNGVFGKKSHRKILKERNFKKKKSMRGSMMQAIPVFSQLRPSQLHLRLGFQ